MRTPLVLGLSALLACGGSPPPAADTAATPPADTAPSVEPAPAVAVEPPAPPAEPAAPAGPARAASTLEGTLLGKPFKGIAACVAGAGAGPGKVYLEVYDVKDFDVKTSCGRLPPVPGARKIGMMIAWKDGAKTDLGTLKVSKDPQLFVMAAGTNPKKMDRKDAPKDWKPQGTIEVIRAAGKGGFGRIKFDVTVGKDRLAGEVDVDVMADVGG